MDHRAFFDDVAKGKIAPCYVFEGTEEYIKRSRWPPCAKSCCLRAGGYE